MTDSWLAVLALGTALALPTCVIWAGVLLVRSAVASQHRTGRSNRIAKAALRGRDALWPFEHLSSPVNDDDPQATVQRMRNRWRLIGLQPYIHRWALVAIGLGLGAVVFDQVRVVTMSSPFVATVAFVLASICSLLSMASTTASIVLLALWWRWGLGR